MSDPADSAGAPGEATGASIVGTDDAADSTPNSEATGQEQGDQARINGLMALANKRLSERDQALAEIAELKAMLAQQDVAEEQHDPSQVELMFPERFTSIDTDEGEEIDPMAPPEPPVITMQVNPSRSQSAPLGVAPVIGDASSPAVRYARDQAEIAQLKTQLNALGAQWVEEAKQTGLMEH